MITFDPAKDQTNRNKHGISLAEADILDWSAALTWEDDRKDYGEIRLVALLPMADRLYCCVYVERSSQAEILIDRDGSPLRSINSFSKTGRKNA